MNRIAAAPALPATVTLLDLPVHPITLGGAVDLLLEAIVSRHATTVVSLNGALLMRARKDDGLAGAIQGASLIIPDGVGIILAARILGIPVPGRVPGVDLTEALCRRAAERGARVFLLGAAPGTAEAAGRRLAARCPGLVVVGAAHGFFHADDEREVLARIAAAHPDILLVALGAPRQERWLHRHAPTLRVPVMMGVGGTLDVLAGRTRRAPAWMQAAGLEWLYRMTREPWRWSVVRTIPPLFVLALKERWQRRGNY